MKAADRACRGRRTPRVERQSRAAELSRRQSRAGWSLIRRPESALAATGFTEENDGCGPLTMGLDKALVTSDAVYFTASANTAVDTLDAASAPPPLGPTSCRVSV